MRAALKEVCCWFLLYIRASLGMVWWVTRFSCEKLAFCAGVWALGCCCEESLKL